MLESSFSRVDFEQITRALWTRVEIKLVFRFMGQKEFQRMYWPVKVGFSALKARLSDLAHAYCGNPIDIGDFLILKECIQATRSLRCNENIHITKPDKGFGVVIMNKIDYISKMDFILQGNSKFENLGPSSEFDNTVKIEAHIQRRLLQLKKEGLLPSKIYSRIRPTGSQRPRMYGLPKIHKQDVPLRPILSMTGSAQHQLA